MKRLRNTRKKQCRQNVKTRPHGPRARKAESKLEALIGGAPQNVPNIFIKPTVKHPRRSRPPPTPNKAAGPMVRNPIKKKIVAQVFSQTIPETFKKTYFVEHVSADT